MTTRVETLNKSVDFGIRVIILVNTIITLLYFSGIYNQLLFGALLLILLISMIIKGITDFMIARKK